MPSLTSKDCGSDLLGQQTVKAVHTPTGQSSTRPIKEDAPEPRARIKTLKVPLVKEGYFFFFFEGQTVPREPLGFSTHYKELYQSLTVSSPTKA